MRCAFSRPDISRSRVSKQSCHPQFAIAVAVDSEPASFEHVVRRRGRESASEEMCSAPVRRSLSPFYLVSAGRWRARQAGNEPSLCYASSSSTLRSSSLGGSSITGDGSVLHRFSHDLMTAMRRDFFIYIYKVLGEIPSRCLTKFQAIRPAGFVFGVRAAAGTSGTAGLCSNNPYVFIRMCKQDTKIRNDPNKTSEHLTSRSIHPTRTSSLLALLVSVPRQCEVLAQDQGALEC